MKSIFREYSSLTSLPDISIWNTEKLTYISNMFNGCSSLISLPDISKWSILKVDDLKGLFCNLSIKALI